MDQFANWISVWSYKSAGKSNLPLTVRAIVGKGWGQGPQHGKSLHSWFSHLPGLSVVVPSSPYEAKGLLLSSIFSNFPTLFIETRSLYSMKENVPLEPYFLDPTKWELTDSIANKFNRDFFNRVLAYGLISNFFFKTRQIIFLPFVIINLLNCIYEKNRSFKGKSKLC